MNIKKWYVLAALIVTVPTVHASVQSQVRSLADQPVSVATFTNLANTLKQVGPTATKLPGEIKENIQTKYGVDVKTILAMDPAKIAALARLETALTNYQASRSVGDAEDVVNEAMTVGNENPILKIFGASVQATLTDANATIAGHTATTRLAAATGANAITTLRTIADELQQIEENAAHPHLVNAGTNDVDVIINTPRISHGVHVDVWNAKLDLNDLRRGGPLDAANPANHPAVFNAGPLAVAIQKTFAEQVQDMIQQRMPHITKTLPEIAVLNGILGGVSAILNPATTPTPNDFNAMKIAAEDFIDWSYYAIQQTDAELERVATPLAPAFTLPVNDTLVNRTTALLNHLAGPGAGSATLDAYLNGLRPHGTPLTTSCGLDAAQNITGNTAQMITDVNTALGYVPVDQAGGIRAMQDILTSLSINYAGLTTDQKVDHVIKKLLFDQYKTFMWLTKNSGTPGTDYPGTPATAGVGNIAQARITQLNNALRGFHAGTGGVALLTGQDHQLVTLGNSLQTALDTKLNSCSTANLFSTPLEVNVPNLVIAVNQMKDVITNLAPAGIPAAAGSVGQLAAAITNSVRRPALDALQKYTDLNNSLVNSFIDYDASATGSTPNTNNQNNIKHMAWTLQSLAHAANLRNGLTPVPAPAAFDATTYAGIAGIAAPDKLHKATLVQDIINGIRATALATTAAGIPTTLAAPFYTGASDISRLLTGSTQAILAPTAGVNQGPLTGRITDICSIIHELGDGIAAGPFNKATLTNLIERKLVYGYAEGIHGGGVGAATINGSIFDDPANYRSGLSTIETLFGGVTLIGTPPATFTTTWNAGDYLDQIHQVSGGTAILVRIIDQIASNLGLPVLHTNSYPSFSALMKATQQALANIARAAGTTPAVPATGGAVVGEVAEHNAAIDDLQKRLDIGNFYGQFPQIALADNPLANPIYMLAYNNFTTFCVTKNYLTTTTTPNQYNVSDLGKIMLDTNNAVLTPASSKTLKLKNILQDALPMVLFLNKKADYLKTIHPPATVKKFDLKDGLTAWVSSAPLSRPIALPTNLMITNS